MHFPALPLAPLAALALLASSAACTPDAGEPQPPRPVARDCAAPAPAAAVAAEYAAGRAALEAARDGEHLRSQPFDEAVQALGFAARHGHVAAQSLYGRTVFATLYARQAPDPVLRPEERDAYVSALAFLRLAALSGDERAIAFLPGIADTPVPRSDAPLAFLPREWLEAAVDAADLWLACRESARSD